MKPDLSHYIGRNVVNLFETDDGFSIELDGNVVVTSEDSGNEEMPDQNVLLPEDARVAPAQLLNTIFTANETVMIFGRAEQPGQPPVEIARATLSPTKYRIGDPAFGNEPQRPQAVEIEETPTRAEEQPTVGPEAESQEAADKAQEEAQEAAESPSEPSEAPEEGESPSESDEG